MYAPTRQGCPAGDSSDRRSQDRGLPGDREEGVGLLDRGLQDLLAERRTKMATRVKTFEQALDVLEKHKEGCWDRNLAASTQMHFNTLFPGLLIPWFPPINQPYVFNVLLLYYTKFSTLFQLTIYNNWLLSWLPYY